MRSFSLPVKVVGFSVDDWELGDGGGEVDNERRVRGFRPRANEGPRALLLAVAACRVVRGNTGPRERVENVLKKGVLRMRPGVMVAGGYGVDLRLLPA